MCREMKHDPAGMGDQVASMLASQTQHTVLDHVKDLKDSKERDIAVQQSERVVIPCVNSEKVSWSGSVQVIM